MLEAVDLYDFVDRLEELFAGETAAIEALEAVRFWAIEESV